MYDAWQVTFYLSSLAGLASIPPISEQLDKSLPFQQAVDKAQAAAQAGMTTTNAAAHGGVIGMMATGSVGLVVGIFLGIVIRGAR